MQSNSTHSLSWLSSVEPIRNQVSWIPICGYINSNPMLPTLPEFHEIILFPKERNFIKNVYNGHYHISFSIQELPSLISKYYIDFHRAIGKRIL